MFRKGVKTVANATGDSRTIDMIVVLAAGLFFANIVLGTNEETTPILAYAAEIQSCGTGCAVIAASDVGIGQ